MTRALALLVLAFGCTAASAGPAPFVAEYRVLRGSMHIADARIELSRDSEDGWTLRSTTEPVALFRLITDDVIVETSTFRYGEAGPIPLHYHYEQRNSNKDRDERLAFDWAAGKATGVSRGKQVDLAVARGTLDPLLMRIAVGDALARGALPKSYAVVERGRLRDRAAIRTAPAKVKLPIGTLELEGVERVSEDGRKTTRLEYAPALGWLPAVIEHREQGEATYRMELKQLKR
jgi:hypothetical protein